MNLPVLSLYQQIGGETQVRALVSRFYMLMDTLEQARAIRAMHDADLSHIQEVLVEFLTGWLGGPPLYTEKYGHPRLRQRHLHLAIGIPERDAWLACMDQAMEEVGISAELQTQLRAAFFKTADFMRNT